MQETRLLWKSTKRNFGWFLAQTFDSLEQGDWWPIDPVRLMLMALPDFTEMI